MLCWDYQAVPRHQATPATKTSGAQTVLYSGDSAQRDDQAVPRHQAAPAYRMSGTQTVLCSGYSAQTALYSGVIAL